MFLQLSFSPTVLQQTFHFCFLPLQFAFFVDKITTCSLESGMFCFQGQLVVFTKKCFALFFRPQITLAICSLCSFMPISPGTGHSFQESINQKKMLSASGHKCNTPNYLSDLGRFFAKHLSDKLLVSQSAYSAYWLVICNASGLHFLLAKSHSCPKFT